MLLAACGGGGSKLPDDPREAVVQAMKAQLKATPFRVTMDIESEGDKTKQVFEFVSPERFHMNMGDMEIILVDGKAYRKQDNSWVEDEMMASIASGLTGMFSDTAIASMTGMIKDVKQSGSEDIDGQKTRVYEFTSEGTIMGIESKSSGRMWVRELDGLPVKQVVDGEAAGMKSITTQIIEYDPNIKIEAPVQ